MKTTKIGVSNPTACIAINKSRLKQYDKNTKMPTYYLQKGQEFQIELFNPTTEMVLAKIELNGKLISQTGLILKPGQRYFLDRYIDIDKKFLFDTYEVSKTKEVQEAIKNNGDIRILFFKERIALNFNPFYVQSTPISYDTTITTGSPYVGTLTTNTSGNASSSTYTTTSLGMASSNTIVGSSVNTFYNSTNSPSLDFAPDVLSRDIAQTDSLKSERNTKSLKSKVRSSSKKMETGRVEEGSKSDQTFTYVRKSFENYSFHSVSYKLLPLSQQNVDTSTLYKKYCTNCGGKTKSGDKFCSKCGNKI